MKKFQSLINTEGKLMIETKKNVICYQCNKKGHYKLQCFELIKKQFKNANQTSVRKIYIKGKNQCLQKTSQMQSKRH